MLETRVDLGFDQTCFVDSTILLGVVQSLPESSDLTMQLDNGVLHWECGRNASGRVATVSVDGMLRITRRNPLRDKCVTLDRQIQEAFSLGALSVGVPALGSVGLYGVVVDNRNQLTVCSSDDVTVAVCQQQHQPAIPAKVLTLAPEGAELLEKLAVSGHGLAELSENGVFYMDEDYRCQLGRRAPLKYDLAPVYEPYMKSDHLVPIERDRVAAFIRRVNALSQDKANMFVQFSTHNGNILLTFEEGIASSSEYYVVQGADIPDITPITLKAKAIARALDHVTHVALDHIEDRVLAFHGDNAKLTFRYIIAARQN